MNKTILCSFVPCCLLNIRFVICIQVDACNCTSFYFIVIWYSIVWFIHFILRWTFRLFPVLSLEQCCHEHSFTFTIILVHLHISFLRYTSNSGNGGSWVYVSSTLQSNAKLLSKEAVTFYTHISSVGKSLLLHILAKLGVMRL